MYPAYRGSGEQMQNLPCGADTWRHSGLGKGCSRPVSRLSLLSSLVYQSSPGVRRCWALGRRVGSYYFVSLLDFIFLFKPSSAGNLEGREVSSRIEAPNVPGTLHKGPTPQQFSQDAKDVILRSHFSHVLATPPNSAYRQSGKVQKNRWGERRLEILSWLCSRGDPSSRIWSVVCPHAD